MSKKSNPVRNTLLIVGGVLAMLLLFGVVLRAALAPLYQDVAELKSGGSGGGGESGSNVDINVGGVGGLLNWAFGWAWGGPGWYGPGHGGGWWGGSWWRNWNGRWDSNGHWWDGNGNRWDNNGHWWDGNGNRVTHESFRGGHGGFHGGGGGGHSHGGGRR